MDLRPPSGLLNGKDGVRMFVKKERGELQRDPCIQMRV